LKNKAANAPQEPAFVVLGTRCVLGDTRRKITDIVSSPCGMLISN
jgi:hypothetical protein